MVVQIGFGILFGFVLISCLLFLIIAVAGVLVHQRDIEEEEEVEIPVRRRRPETKYQETQRIKKHARRVHPDHWNDEV